MDNHGKQRFRKQVHAPSRGFGSPATPHRPFLGMVPVLKTEQCTGCGACLDVCMFEAIEFNGKPSFDETRCKVCGACIAMCPEEAIIWPS